MLKLGPNRMFASISFHRAFARAAVLSTLVLTPVAALAQNMIESINSVPLGATTQLRIKLKSALPAAPPGFAINNPPRIALDLVGVENQTGQPAQEFAQGDVRSVNIVQAAGRSRIVLNLRRAVQYTTENEGNTIVVNLSPTNVTTAQVANTDRKSVV